MKKLEMLRGAVELLVSTGVSIIMGGILVKMKPTDIGTIKKIAVGVGALAMSMFVSDKVTEHVDAKWIETENQIKEFLTPAPVEEEIEKEEEEEAL